MEEENILENKEPIIEKTLDEQFSDLLWFEKVLYTIFAIGFVLFLFWLLGGRK